MYPKEKMILSVIMGSAICLSANAEPIIQTINFNGLNGSANFYQFDNHLGNLNSIKIEVSLSISGGQINYDNDSDSWAAGNLQFGAYVNLLSTSDVSLLDIAGQSILDDGKVFTYNSCGFNLAPDNDDGSYDSTPPDGGFLNGSSLTCSDSGLIGNAYMGQGTKGFLGTDTYNILYTILQWTDLSGDNIDGIEYSCTPPVSASGYITITYNYDPIPEPCVLSLLTCGIAVLRIKKRKANLSFKKSHI